jgi:hypothetical protein
MSCKNCDFELEESNRFCSNCGSPVITKRLTFKQIIHEFSERYFSFDNKFLQTFIALFKSPQLVINGFIEGLRTRYVNPVTYAIIAVTVSGFSVYLIKKGFYGDVISKAIAQTKTNEKVPFDMKAYMEWVFDYQNIIFFLSIPLLGIFSKIVFYDVKKFNIAEHSLIYTYTYSQFTIIMFFLSIILVMILGLDYLVYSYLTFPLMIAYHAYALKKVFDLSVSQIMLKLFLFLALMGVLMIVFIIIMVIGIIIYNIQNNIV